MKIDSRIPKRPLDCLDVDTARQYIGKEVYCADSLFHLIDLEYRGVFKGKLERIHENTVYAFEIKEGQFSYIVPAEWITRS